MKTDYCRKKCIILGKVFRDASWDTCVAKAGVSDRKVKPSRCFVECILYVYFSASYYALHGVSTGKDFLDGNDN